MSANPKLAAELAYVLRMRVPVRSESLADAIAAIGDGTATQEQVRIVARNLANLGRCTFSANVLRDCRYAATAMCDAGLAVRADFPGVLSAHNDQR